MAIVILPAANKDARRAGALARAQQARDDIALDAVTCMALATIFYKCDAPVQDWMQLGDGWRLLKTVSPADGYDGMGLHHAASRSLVMVNRGAEGLKSIRDFLEGFEAAFGAWDGPLLHAVDLMVECFGICADEQLPVEKVVCAGHSWGGALAEAQVAVGRPLLVRDHGYTGDVWGVGIGSAGFAEAIRGLAVAKGVAIDLTEVRVSMTHFIRTRDLILLQPNHELLGGHTTLASIYQNGHGQKPAGNAPAPQIWSYKGGENHTSVYYFDFRDHAESMHLYMRSNDTFALVEGRTPPLVGSERRRPPYAQP